MRITVNLFTFKRPFTVNPFTFKRPFTVNPFTFKRQRPVIPRAVEALQTRKITNKKDYKGLRLWINPQKRQENKESALSGSRQSRKQAHLKVCFVSDRLASIVPVKMVCLRRWSLRDCLAEREVKIDFKRPKSQFKTARQ